MKPAKAPLSSGSDDGNSRAFILLEEFSGDLAFSLIDHILRFVGEFRKTRLIKLVNELEIAAYRVKQLDSRLTMSRRSHGSMRASRQRFGRACAQVEHCLQSLLKAENALRAHESEVRPGLLNFRGPEKGLKHLKKTLEELEATAAALIHPGLRTAKDELLAVNTPYKLHHPDLPITEGSAELQYLAVELIDDRLQRFTRGKVPHTHEDKFISEFLKIVFGWTVSPANVKTIRQRNKDAIQRPYGIDGEQQSS